MLINQIVSEHTHVRIDRRKGDPYHQISTRIAGRETLPRNHDNCFWHTARAWPSHSERRRHPPIRPAAPEQTTPFFVGQFPLRPILQWPRESAERPMRLAMRISLFQSYLVFLIGGVVTVALSLVVVVPYEREDDGKKSSIVVLMCGDAWFELFRIAVSCFGSLFRVSDRFGSRISRTSTTHPEKKMKE